MKYLVTGADGKLAGRVANQMLSEVSGKEFAAAFSGKEKKMGRTVGSKRGEL